jgi:hypothetical protein
MRPLLLIFSFVLFQQYALALLAAKEGYYVTMDNDTVRGTIKIRVDFNDEPYFFRIQYGAFYEDSTGNVIQLDPDHVKCFVFFHKIEYIKFVSLEYYSNYRMFLRAINEQGHVKLYQHYKNVVDTRTDFHSLSMYLLEYPASSEEDFFFLTKPDGTSVKYGKYSGKKNISRFFADYPVLHKKIQRGLYGYTAVYMMVREYNRWKAEGG